MFWIKGCSFEDFIRKHESFQPITTPPYQPPLLHPADFQMTPIYYPPTPPMPIDQTVVVHPYPTASGQYSNFFMFPATTATAMSYSEGLISQPISYSVPASIPSSTPVSTPTQLSNNEMVKAFENLTVSSLPTSPQVTDDNEQTDKISNTVDSGTVSE